MSAADQPKSVSEGQLLWTPSAEWIEQANLTKFMRWLKAERGLDFADYRSLWQWSVDNIEDFWAAIWDYFEIKASKPYDRVLDRGVMPDVRWFPGAELNYAEHILAKEKPGTPAMLFLNETTPLREVDWAEVGSKVRIIATQLRKLGIKPGDRVAGYLPNIPETAIAMLAATSIGAVWTCCSPDFGSKGVIERMQQLEPKLIFTVDGYQYGGRSFSRLDDARQIIESIPSLEHVVQVNYHNPAATELPVPHAKRWSDLLDHPPVAKEDFKFEQVPFSHPLWVLFSSGTTGLPKAIVHSHGGILLELLKAMHFHMEVRPGDRTFSFTTTGWTMWNLLIGYTLGGAVPVLYDGNPAYPDPDTLWKMAQDSGAALFGASPSFVDIMMKAGIVPGEKYDLSKLRVIMPVGSPVSPDCNAWFYNNVKKDVWIAVGSGGTDICSGFVGGVVTQPVYAGEIQAPSLGVAAKAFNDDGESVVNEVGELVITEPMPSMPIYFWADPDGSRYREAYFETYPGVWRQGDFFRINERNGCYVLGRSDATLNRHGVRIGTAEIYNAVMAIPGIVNALIINLDLPGGKFFMPLFVKLAPGVTLDAELEKTIKTTLRTEYTPRHVPDAIIQVPEIPMTITGKRLEVPVRRIMMGMPVEKAANRNAMADPSSLDFFIDYAKTFKDSIPA